MDVSRSFRDQQENSTRDDDVEEEGGLFCFERTDSDGVCERVAVLKRGGCEITRKKQQKVKRWERMRFESIYLSLSP